MVTDSVSEIAYHVVCRAEGYSDISLLDCVCYKEIPHI